MRIKHALFFMLTIVFLLTVSCREVAFFEVSGAFQEATTYCIEYFIYQGEENQSPLLVKEWFKDPNYLFQEIYKNGILYQQVIVNQGTTTIYNIEQSNSFAFQRVTESPIRQLYHQLDDKAKLKKSKDGYKLEAIIEPTGWKLAVQMDANGLPLKITIMSGDLIQEEYRIVTLELNCPIKDSLFKEVSTH